MELILPPQGKEQFSIISFPAWNRMQQGMGLRHGTSKFLQEAFASDIFYKIGQDRGCFHASFMIHLLSRDGYSLTFTDEETKAK